MSRDLEILRWYRDGLVRPGPGEGEPYRCAIHLVKRGELTLVKRGEPGKWTWLQITDAGRIAIAKAESA